MATFGENIKFTDKSKSIDDDYVLSDFKSAQVCWQAGRVDRTG
jgi:hypothetical protein